MNQNNHTWSNQTGAVAIIVAVSMVMIVGFSALAIDIGRRMLIENQVQNAADAGALAGARVLYLNNGTIINTGADQEAEDAAMANNAAGKAVSIVSVDRGHWNFSLRAFTPNDTTEVIDLTGMSDEDLDAELDLINAVQVRAKTDGSVRNFFAGFLGFADFEVEKDAVAWIGFAGSLFPFEVDQPIAICEDSILVDGAYSCNIGRMINSGNTVATNDTARWTNFDQSGGVGCAGGTVSNSDLVDIFDCDGSVNKDPIVLGMGMVTNNGQKAILSKIRDCFFRDNPPRIKNVTLPVVVCGGDPNCGEMVGAVNVNIVWISGEGQPQADDAPIEIWKADGSGPEWYGGDILDGAERWASFVDHFNLKNVQDLPATHDKKSIYFMPDCEKHEPVGGSQGRNYGVRAEIPLLVE